jgi:hypothetical protein
MVRPLLTLAAASLLVLGGALHGLWTQRWAELTEPAVQAAGHRLRDVPLKAGSWDGRPIVTDEATLPEEVVGRNVTLRYVHRVRGDVVVVFLACGHTAAMELHTPLECYPAHGYTTVGPVSRVRPPAGPGEGRPEFWAATFSQGEAAAPVHLRVLWSWKDAGPWQAPDNPGRAFRASPFLYKCYAIRQLSTLDEPLDGDPCADLLASLLPRLDQVLAADR